MQYSTSITSGGMISFIIFNVLTIPCFASIATAKGELPDKKTFVYSVLFWLGVSYFVSSAFYLMIDFIWPIAIFVPLLIGGFVLIYLLNKKRNVMESK